MRWLGQFLVFASLVCILVIAAYMFMGMVAAVVIMVSGVLQSTRANKTGEKPQVSDRCLYTVFYMFGIPAMCVLLVVGAEGGEDSLAFATTGYKIVLSFTVYLVLRYLILPKLMRRSTLASHNHAAWILAILLWPCYATPLFKLGVPMMFYDLSWSILNLINS